MVFNFLVIFFLFKKGFVGLFFNFLIFIFTFLNIFFGLELYFRFLYDQTDVFNFLRTSQSWFDRHVAWNNKGFRDEDFTLQKEKGIKRIVVLGDSFAFGHGVKKEDSVFSSLLEKKLNRKQSVFQVYNFSRLGWDTIEEVDYLENEIVDYSPDLLILSYYLNDIASAAEIYSSFDTFKAFEIPNKFLAFFVGHSYAINFFYYRFVGATNSSLKQLNSLLVEAYKDSNVWERQKTYFLKIIEISREKDFPLLVIIFPFMNKVGEDYPYDFIHQQLKEFLEKEKIPVIDLLEDFSAYKAKDLAVNSFDPHPNKKAHEITAQRIFDFLNQESLEERSFDNK